jgi:hypothetical protein
MLALTTLVATPAVAQTLALRESASAPHPRELAPSYRIRLLSDWPQLPVTAGCVNGGSETVEGVLTRTGGGEYTGSFSRRTRLLFCGAHGADGEPCELVLEGDGPVAVRGTVVEGDQLRVVWTPGPEHRADVRGACGAEFKQKVRSMYLTVRHGAEFELPVPGAAPRMERLEDYAWMVEVRN